MLKSRTIDIKFMQLKIIILRKRDPPTSLRTEYQIQNEIQIGRNQKVIKIDNDELIVQNYPKTKKTTKYSTTSTKLSIL